MLLDIQMISEEFREFRNVHITLKEETEVTFLLPPSSSSSLSLLLMKHSCRFLWL